MKEIYFKFQVKITAICVLSFCTKALVWPLRTGRLH
jgi:hypothetical protein